MKDCATVTLCGHDAFFKGKKPWFFNSEKKKAILGTPKRKISDNHIFFKGNDTEMALCGTGELYGHSGMYISQCLTF